MLNFLNKLLGHQAHHIIKEDAELEKFFTDAVHAREVFDGLIRTTSSSKHLIVIHGRIGAVGKSSLLKMYRLQCKRSGNPVALVSVEDIKSEVDILSNWADDLKKDGIELKNFLSTRERYRAIIAQVDTQKLKVQEKSGKATEIAGKVAIKTTEATAGAIIGAAAGSIVPGIGTVAGALGGAIIGTSAEELKDFYRSFLPKSDIELLFDPAANLTNDFLKDIEQTKSKRRIVMMLDTFEQMETLSIWLCGIVKHLPENVLFIISGRTIPEWDRKWSGWMGKAEIIEIKEMEQEDIRTLVYRYYAFIRGGEPNSKQVEAIVQFARGLPIVATTAIKLWVKYPRDEEDFKAVKPQVLADLVDRLLEGVPIEWRSAFEVAAVLRYFNADMLGALLKSNDSNELYTELRRWPFTRSSNENYLALHDVMREMINKEMYMRTPVRFHTLHERAATYYEELMKKYTGEEAESLGLEQLYHRISANEETGIQLFHERAEELVRYRLVNHLRVLLNDVNNYSLEKEDSQLWREYYNARLAHLESRLNDAVAVYSKIANNANPQSRLRAYSLSDLGEIYSHFEYLMKPNGFDKGVDVLEKSIEIIPIDEKTALSWISLSWIYRRFSKWEMALFYVDKAFQFYKKSSNTYGLVHCSIQKISIYALLGHWKNALDAKREAISLLSSLSIPKYAKIKIFGRWSLGIWIGQWNSAEKEYRESMDIAESLEDFELYGEASKRLGWVLGLQGRHEEMEELFTKTTERISRLNRDEIWPAAVAKGFQGLALLNKDTHEARIHLQSSLKMKVKIKDDLGLPELFYGFGLSFEIDRDYEKSESHYRECLDHRKNGRCYYECGALTGLFRVKYAQKNFSLIPLLAEAEKLAEQYEYNDHLASLYLYRGHIAWKGHIPELGKGFDIALKNYQHALIYALRYNRFLLDEVLSGRPGTALRPIIPCCLERGEEGQQILIALKDWWGTGINNTGIPRTDTISLIPENISLMEAENIAREREIGDGLPQATVVEQIKVALTQ